MKKVFYDNTARLSSVRGIGICQAMSKERAEKTGEDVYRKKQLQELQLLYFVGEVLYAYLHQMACPPETLMT